MQDRNVCRTCKGRRESRRKPAPPSNGVRTIAILADVHGRERDHRAWGAVLAWLRARRIDEVILLGDFLELASVGEHGGCADEGELLADLDAGRALLREVMDAAPGAAVTYLEGNHETRLPRYIEHRAAPLAGALTLPEALRLADLGVRWVPERDQPIARGTLRLMHGHQDLARPPQYHAAKIANLRGRQGTVTVYGHVHRPQHIARIGEESAHAIGLGCLRTLAPGWEHGRASGWEHGFGVAYVSDSGRADVYPVAVRNGAIVWDGRVYGTAA